MRGPLASISVVALGIVVAALFAGAAWAYQIYGGGTKVSPSEIQGWASNSSIPSLRNNPEMVSALAGYESAGTYNTGVYNGSCCTGLFQFNNANARAYGGQFGVSDRFGFAGLSGEQQFKAYEKFYQEGYNNRYTQQLIQRGELGGKPVDQATIMACIQLGPVNCREAQANGCTDKRNGHGGDGSVSVCSFAQNLRDRNNGKGGTDNGGGGGCTTPTEPKEASKPGNIGAGDGSGNPAPAAASGGSASGAAASGGSGAAGGSGTPETPSKSVPCKQAESKATDKTSKTCQPTMKMINELQCSNFPSSIQSFCQQYKPKLMTSDECSRAEKMAEKEKKGERQTECENQTFAQPGTSAWSYVLACSFTQKNQGTFGSATQASDGKTGSTGGGGGSTSGDGNPDDPQCVERLKKRIPDLKVLGGVTISANGTTCGMKSGVSSTGIPGVTISPAVTVECLEMEKLADFAEQMKGKGVTRMTNIGSLDRTCRWIRNASGTHVGKVSSHAYGMAVDLSGFYLGGQYFDTKRYWSDSSTKAWMDANVRPLACQIFKGVLGPYFYRGAYSHFHVEMRQKTSCDRGR